MEAILDRPKKTWVKPDHKLTDDEIEELIENYDYDPYIYDDEDESDELDPIYDIYGNPTESTIRAMYEGEHGISTSTTVDELLSWVNSL